VMAEGTHPTHSNSDTPEDPWGMECVFASTMVNSEATGPRTVQTKCRTDWPAQGNVTEPQPPSQQLTLTREQERERESHPARALASSNGPCSGRRQRLCDGHAERAVRLVGGDAGPRALAKRGFQQPPPGSRK